MKYTIEGFSQEEAVKIGLDVIDLALLRWIIDFYNTGAMEMRYFDQKSFFWVCYDALLRDMPILGITNSTSLGRRFKRMVKSGLLEFRMFQTKNGSKSFYRLNSDCLVKLLSKRTNTDEPLDLKVKRTLIQKSGGALPKRQALYIDPNTSDPNTIDLNIHAFFDYFCLKTGKQYKLTSERKRIIRQRLVEGFTIDQLKMAVDNFIQDDWPERYKYIDVIYCIGRQNGKPDALEKWLNYTNNHKSDKSAQAYKQVTDVFLNEKLGRIATKDMIKEVLKDLPQNVWWKVNSFLHKQYPGDNGSVFAEVERELVEETRNSKERIGLLTSSIIK